MQLEAHACGTPWEGSRPKTEVDTIPVTGKVGGLEPSLQWGHPDPQVSTASGGGSCWVAHSIVWQCVLVLTPHCLTNCGSQ